jgi:2-aminobenzoate-CoA ligase
MAPRLTSLPADEMKMWNISVAPMPSSISMPLACSKSGAVCCPSLHRDHTVGDVAELMTRTRCTAFIWQNGYGADADKRDLIEALKTVPTLRHIYRLEPQIGAATPIVSPSDIASASKPEVEVKSDPNRIVYLAFTSGTTGKPKAAVHTHRDVLAACEAWPRHVLRATPDDIVVGSPPLAFTFGLGGLLVFPMWAGASVYFPDAPYTPEALVQTIQDVGATICYTAPTFYRQMAPFARERGTGKLRVCVSAGEGLPDATRQLWKEASGIEMTDGIGATEMFHIFISSPPGEVRRGAIGQVVPGYHAKVVDDDGQEVARGTVGKLAVIGPTGCKYLDEPRQASYVKAGWNYPGDAFMQDADGYFFYQARADDMIITAGYNVGGPEVEDALLKHPAVAECGVIGKADEERGMIVKAFCVLKAGHAGDAAMVKALQDHVKSIIAPYKYPREIEFVAALPRTETGKLQRFKLREGARA